jgi:hypothetical protein
MFCRTDYVIEMSDSKPKLTPEGVTAGDRLQTAFSVVRVDEVRSGADEEHTQYHITDEDTGEELWVDYSFLVAVCESNSGERHGSGWTN